MMELKIASRTIEDESGRTRRFHYALLIDQIESGHFACEDYGVSICEEGGDRTAVPGITTNATRIDELITLLVEHKVGPTTLADVVADWL